MCAKSVLVELVEATLTELRRETTKVVRPAMHGGEEITITEHGQAMFKIVPVPVVAEIGEGAAAHPSERRRLEIEARLEHSWNIMPARC